ncbi:MAG TPA: AI-2E family transporter [Terriglobia bacterium]|nr:AI-2E family transporter [Terriglobia bacterium]
MGALSQMARLNLLIYSLEKQVLEETIEANSPSESKKTSPVPGTSVTQSITSIAVIGAICYLLQPVLVTLCVSLLFAFMLAPPTDLLQRAKLPRSVAAFLSVTFVSATLYGITYFSYDQGMRFIEELPRHASKYRQAILRVRQQAETLQKTSESVLPKTAGEKTAIRVVQQPDAFDALFRNVGSVAEFVFLLSFVPFLVFFMLTWQDHLHTATVLLARPENRRRTHRTLTLVGAMIRSFLLGSLLIGLVIGGLSTLFFGFLRLPYFYFTGFLSGFLSLVPYLGIVLAPIPPFLAGADVIDAKDALAIVAVVTILHVIAVNLLYPKMLGNRLRVNPVVLTIALLFWGWLWGGVGLLLAIPITAAMKIIFDHVSSLRAYGKWMGTTSLAGQRRRRQRHWLRSKNPPGKKAA